uniref:Uncharacterized protein n=1 Tax=Sphenodon punctatus TaxID=8508 RepID=A0A8D0G1K9_SPHPU
MLKQWKAAWKWNPRWENATIEGLMRGLTDIHVENRVQAIITCATAVLERPRRDVEDNAFEKASTIQDVPEELQPLLMDTLKDLNAHVRMAAAVCHYAIGMQNDEAQAIMKKALACGNAADSWAAAQCLAMESIASIEVVKRILSQMFAKKDDATEKQACLLLMKLSEQTGLVHSLLASELNSCQWKDRILACRALSCIHGCVSQDLKNKLAQLMWTDWNSEVRQAAAQALGRLNRVALLSTNSCIFPFQVLKCLLKVMQTDPHWKIKAFAIRALGQIGQVSPQIKDLLLWAIHYEEKPDVRREACHSIVTLQLQDESVRAALLERLILEPNEMNLLLLLSQKDLVIQKLLKLEEITERMWQEASRIYRAKEESSDRRDLMDVLITVLEFTFSGNPCG